MIAVIEEVHDRKPPDTEPRDGWDRFGFLPSPVGCRFHGGEIDPVSNYTNVRQWVQHHLYNSDLSARQSNRLERGVLFPPTAWRQARDARADATPEVVPFSTHPALLHRVPTSHYVRLDGGPVATADRPGAPSFVTKLLGFLFDTPAQFHDWLFDGPVSVGANGLGPAPRVLEHFVSHAYATWRSWTADVQQLLIAALHMHCRAPGYQWHWERFAWEYAVTDACYRLSDLLRPGRVRAANGRRPTHSQRVGAMCRELGVRFGDDESRWVDSAVTLRNELIHEVRWCGTQPSTKASDSAADAPRALHKLNQRLIVGLLDYRSAFVGSGWLTFTSAPFDRMS